MIDSINNIRFVGLHFPKMETAYDWTRVGIGKVCVCVRVREEDGWENEREEGNDEDEYEEEGEEAGEEGEGEGGEEDERVAGRAGWL